MEEESRIMSRREFLNLSLALLFCILFLPTISKEPERVDDLITLFNQREDFGMKVNQDHTRTEWQGLLNKYHKNRAFLHWVQTEDDVPLAGATQIGREIDGTTGLVKVAMMSVYSGDCQMPPEVYQS